MPLPTLIPRVAAEVRSVVLLVEDYAPTVFVTSTYLDSWGFECVVAENGKRALELATQESYLTILMDVQIGAWSGFDVTRLIRQHEKERGNAAKSPPQRPHWIIGMTAHANSGDRERCLAEGMNDYLAKPFEPELLKDKLVELKKRLAL